MRRDTWLMLILLVVAGCQWRESPDEVMPLQTSPAPSSQLAATVAALKHLSQGIPDGAMIDVRSGSAFRSDPADQTEFIAALGTETGYGIADGRTFMECSEACPPALIRIKPLSFVARSTAEVEITWLRRIDSEFSSWSGRSVVLHLNHANGRWQVAARVREEGFILATPPPRRDTVP